MRVQKSVTNSAAYRFNLFSFMCLQDGPSASQGVDSVSQEVNENEESIFEVYKNLVDIGEWDDEQLELLERFEYLLRQQVFDIAFVLWDCAFKNFIMYPILLITLRPIRYVVIPSHRCVNTNS